MRNGEIWLVDYDPSVGHEYQKQRPSLVIMSDKLVARARLVTVMPITSSMRSARADDVRIKRNEENNLHSNSLIKVQHLHSFDISRFKKQIGVCDASVLVQVKRYIPKHFGLT